MKSVGEVMAIGATFNEARSELRLETGSNPPLAVGGMCVSAEQTLAPPELEAAPVDRFNPDRIQVAAGWHYGPGYDPDRGRQWLAIPGLVEQMAGDAIEWRYCSIPPPSLTRRSLVKEAKQHGFSDAQLAPTPLQADPKSPHPNPPHRRVVKDSYGAPAPSWESQGRGKQAYQDSLQNS